MKKSILLASAFTLAVALPVVLHSSKAFSAVPVQAKPNLPDTPEFDSNKYYRFTSLFLGKGKSLNVTNSIEDAAVHFVNSEANLKGTMGQYWKIEKLSDGYYRINPCFRGFKEEGLDISLDIVSDNLAEDSIANSRTKDVPGQAWKIEKNSNGYYRLTNKLVGAGKSLDVVNDGKEINVQLAPTGDFSGQSWIITEIPTLAEPTTPKPNLPPPPTGAGLTQGQLPPLPTGGLTVQNFRSYAAFDKPIDAKKPDDAHALLSLAVYLVTNEARVKQGKSVIPHHPLLTNAAFDYAREMGTKDFISHNHPSDPAQRTANDRAKRAGIKNANIAENIWGGIGIQVHTYLSLAQSMVDDWMNSPGERAKILSDDSRGHGCGVWLYHDRNNVLSVKAVQKFQLFKDVEVEPLNPNLPKPTAPNPNLPTPPTGAALTVEQQLAEKFRSSAAFDNLVDAEKPNYVLINEAVYFVTNEARVKQGKSLVPYHPLLAKAAFDYAREMVTKDFFDHNHPSDPAQRTPNDRAKRAGIKNAKLAENIGYISSTGSVPMHTYRSLAQELVDWWMNSPGHRANILSDDSRSLGCGVYYFFDRNANNKLMVKAVQNFQLFKDVEE